MVMLVVDNYSLQTSAQSQQHLYNLPLVNAITDYNFRSCEGHMCQKGCPA